MFPCKNDRRESRGQPAVGRTQNGTVFDGPDFPRIHDRPSLLGFIQQQLDADGRLPDPFCRLPDEKPAGPGDITWMAGALDGALGHHAGGAGVEETARDIARAIAAAAAKPKRRQLVALYDKVTNDDVLSFVDATIESLAGLRPSAVAVGHIGTWLASESPDRGPVKLGMALLGVTGAPDGSVLHELGAHEEFTLYAAVAFSNGRENPEPDLFQMARRVTGWGRIHCVERLAETTDPVVARWILTEGFRNSVMYEYLAYTAATTGDLADALADPSPSRELLTAAAEIIDALIQGGPAEDIDDYGVAPIALSRWLDHMARHAETLTDLLTAESVRRFCDDDSWEDRFASGPWTVDIRDRIRSSAVEVIAHPRWPDLVRAGLDSDDPSTFWQAGQAARLLGIDHFDHLLARIDADPLNGPWYEAWRDADRSRAELLVERSGRLLDLRAIATGPSTAIGMGPEFAPHSALGWTLQGLQDHPDLGAELVTVALQSPSIQNRNGALNVLERADGPVSNPEHRRLLEEMATSDPQDKLRARAADVLRSQDER